MTDYFASLLNEVSAPVVAEKPQEPVLASKTGREPMPEGAHACTNCGGSGEYRGRRVHQEKAHCFACRGKGWFTTSVQQREKARAQKAARVVAQHEEAQAAFMAEHPGLIERLRGMASWNSFAARLLEGFAKYDSLTDRQVSAAWAMIAKVEAGRAEREKATAAKSGTLDVEAINAMFSKARESGLKRPRFITKRLKIETPMRATGSGLTLYVKCDGVYAGKIVDGKFTARREAPAETLELLREISGDPVEAARKYGRDTGTCSCCGRKLTDPASIAAGIGPICAAGWF